MKDKAIKILQRVGILFSLFVLLGTVLTIILLPSALVSSSVVSDVVIQNTPGVTIESTTEPTTQTQLKEEATVQETTHTQPVAASVRTVAATTKKPVEKEARVFSVRNIHISAEGCSVNDDRIRFVKSVLSDMPASFFNYNVEKIEFVDEIPEYGENCHGLSTYATKTIQLAINDSSKTLIRSVLYHEFGHFADLTYCGFNRIDCYSYQEEWTEACQGDVSDLSRFYPGLSSLAPEMQKQEAFAMAFDAYFTGRISGSRVNLQQSFPKMYACIKNFVS